MNKPTKPTILSSTTVAKSRLFEIEQLELRFSNGELRTYERMKNKGRGAVMVVVFNDNQWTLVREYCAGSHNYELGFVKGLIDPGETPEQAAQRELQEELGYKANKLTFLKSVALAPSYFASNMTIFLAEQLEESHLEGDEPEPLLKVCYPFAQTDNLLEMAEFSEARSVAALLLAQKHVANRKEM